ncbi:MAG: class II aldolase/adducin family protein [Phycisphaerae bacterium]|nr:class II aldolase/adducin family protein [Phycisphaerae bacterium]
MDKTLADLIRISNITGKDPALIQGGGGNTSVKTPDGKFLYIKASGTDLKNMNARAGWCKLRLAPVLAIMKDKSIAKLGAQPREAKIVKHLLLACTDKASVASRPSVEAHLHAMLDNRCVIHLHPVAVLSFACARNGEIELKKLFKKIENHKLKIKNVSPPLWIPYAHPGFALASQIAKLLADYQNRFGKKPAVLFLQKHGLIVSAHTPDAALKLLRTVINRCKGKLKYPKAVKAKRPNKKIVAEIKQCISEALFKATGKHTVIKYFYDGQIAAFCRDKNAKKLLTPPALTPDELLYVNGPAMWLDDCGPKKNTRRLNSLIKKGKTPPVAFLVKSVGLFVAAPVRVAPAVRDIVKNSFVIRTNAFRLGGICALNKAEQNFINRWEADAFRKKLATGTPAGV